MSEIQKSPSWSAPTPLPGPCRTERLILRFHTPDDAPRLLDALNADRASLLPWLPWVRTDYKTLVDCIYNIERFRRSREEPGCTDFHLGIFDAATGEIVGGMGFHRIVPSLGQAEIGYWIRGERARRGLCTEATAALISLGFQPQEKGGFGFRRIEILCPTQNTASARVPEKLGLRRELAVKSGRWLPEVGFFDLLGWGVLVEEWDIDSRRMRASAAAAEGEQQ